MNGTTGPGVTSDSRLGTVVWGWQRGQHVVPVGGPENRRTQLPRDALGDGFPELVFGRQSRDHVMVHRPHLQGKGGGERTAILASSPRRIVRADERWLRADEWERLPGSVFSRCDQGARLDERGPRAGVRARTHFQELRVVGARLRAVARGE